MCNLKFQAYHTDFMGMYVFLRFSGFMKKSWWFIIPMMFGLPDLISLNHGFPNLSISPIGTMDTLRAGCDRNRRDAMGRCPLFEAARLRCGAVVEIMCQVWGFWQMLNTWFCWCKTSCTSDHQWRSVVWPTFCNFLFTSQVVQDFWTINRFPCSSPWWRSSLVVGHLGGQGANGSNRSAWQARDGNGGSVPLAPVNGNVAKGAWE